MGLGLGLRLGNDTSPMSGSPVSAVLDDEEALRRLRGLPVVVWSVLSSRQRERLGDG